VPVLSFLLLRGRCRTCGGRIAPAHPGMELAAGLVGAVALLAHPGALGAATALFGWWLLLLGALDAERQWLPDRLTLPLIPAGLAAAWLGLGPALESRLIGAAAGFASLWAIGWGYRRLRGRDGLGGGDPKLFGALGAWLGWAQLPFVLLGAGLLGLGAVALRRVRGETVTGTDRLPLGTLLALAAWPIWLLIAVT
jgi:leader peptidase (prepilin peptidase)/N-methyltransferase